MDKTGRIVIPCIYDDAGDFHEGCARVGRNKKYGFIDKNGVEVVPCKYAWAFDFNDGMAQVWEGGEWQYSEDLNEDVLSGCKIGFVDSSGREVIPCQYDYALGFYEGLAMVKGDDDGHEPVFVDKTGHVVIRSVGLRPTAFSEGLACIDFGKKGGGYIDKNGQFVIPARFDTACAFHNGLAMVREGRTWGFIDKTGQMVIEYKTEPEPALAKFDAPDDDIPF
jgi:hypothetical protein